MPLDFIRKSTMWLPQRSWTIGLTCLIALPVLWAILYSVLFSFGILGRLSTGWTVEHWHKAIFDGFLTRTSLYSLYIAFSVTCIVIGTSISLAAFFPNLRHSRWLLMMLLVQSGTPAIVVATQAIYWAGGGGLISRLAYLSGLIDSPNEFPAFVQDPWSIGVILAISLTLLPLAALYFLNQWDIIGLDRYCHLAEQIGCTPWQAKHKVALPMMIKRGSSMLILIFLLALGSYEIPLLLGRQSPQMFSVATQQRASQFNLMNRPQSFALSTVYFVACSGLLVLYLRQRRNSDER